LNGSAAPAECARVCRRLQRKLVAIASVRWRRKFASAQLPQTLLDDHGLNLKILGLMDLNGKKFDAFSRAVPDDSLFISRSLGALIVLTLLPSGMTGCSTSKQTWRDWMIARPIVTANRDRQMMPSSPVLPADNNTLMLAPNYKIGDGADTGPGFNLAMRNPDFPRTHIKAIYIDLSTQAAGVRIKWTGPQAAVAPRGPWRLTPGRGMDGFDCDDPKDSNAFGSLCTPKGVFAVAGFADHLEETPICHYVTWVVHDPRFIGIHSHTDLPEIPASAGCIRVPHEAAKLIHNNSLAGVTLVSIDGKWQRPASPAPMSFVNSAGSERLSAHGSPDKSR
jgi:hypothetical protein